MKNRKFKHYAVFINSFPDSERSSIADDYDIDFFEVLAKDELEMVTMRTQRFKKPKPARPYE